MEKQNSQGNYIMGSFRVVILYQVKIRRMEGGGGQFACMGFCEIFQNIVI